MAKNYFSPLTKHRVRDRPHRQLRTFGICWPVLPWTWRMIRSLGWRWRIFAAYLRLSISPFSSFSTEGSENREGQRCKGTKLRLPRRSLCSLLAMTRNQFGSHLGASVLSGRMPAGTDRAGGRGLVLLTGRGLGLLSMVINMIFTTFFLKASVFIFSLW